MTNHIAGTTSEIPPGARKIVQVESRSIGVFNVKGTYYAIRNNCPHQGAPLCQGRLTGLAMHTMPGDYNYGREGEIITCPWHGWEFDLTNGKSIYDPQKCLVKTYEVIVEHQAMSQPRRVAASMQTEQETMIDTYPVTVEDDLVIIHL
ncbi:3-phenylpropionate/trans-cinnamate dioxygenase ferredoxin subunit [Paenibacillus sp. 1_12]|uniref:Rieske (2Fe-2S) protein n=1 Tax=Paenibacillus sp. 1_12 TaxID=1566278 RepID=UPI0008EAA712|nr:Rieske (2Fe-2S) protein [Paenibacillus sp. 1_12]SFM27248.1 3-phenylpropionate/trans-cinnamate dioxygenase ferredoxin subunit [Paenibacillus sp. 1_12]